MHAFQKQYILVRLKDYEYIQNLHRFRLFKVCVVLFGVSAKIKSNLFLLGLKDEEYALKILTLNINTNLFEILLL